MVVNAFLAVIVLPIANKELMLEPMHKKERISFALAVLVVEFVLLFALEEFLN